MGLGLTPKPWDLAVSSDPWAGTSVCGEATGHVWGPQGFCSAQREEPGSPHACGLERLH